MKNYWPVLWGPLTVLFLFAMLEITRRLPNIFVSRADNIYTDVPLLEWTYDGAATNWEIYENSIEMIDDTMAQFKGLTDAGNNNNSKSASLQ